MGNGNLLKCVLEELPKELVQPLGEPVIEAGRDDCLVSCSVIRTAIVSDRASFAADGEADRERPNQHPWIDSPISDDDFALRARTSIVPDGNNEVNSVVTVSRESFIHFSHSNR
jgi:hypothetical protein